MSELGRRRLIQVGIAGAALLTVGGGALSWITRGYALRAGEVAIGLSVKQMCVARAVVEALTPGGDGLPSGLELEVHQRVDEQVWAADPGMADDLRAALELIEHVPPLLRSRRDLFVQIAMAFKQLVQLCYYADERVWPAIGYDGPWIPEPKPAASALLYAKLLAERGARP